jgi:alpha-galactosidase
MVHERSHTFAEHPDWLLRDDTGAPVSGWNWGGRVYALDTTHPDALAHVCDVLRRAVDWGFTYLKLDFLFCGALPGVRCRAVERHQAYRDAVEAFRDAVGDDVVLLACGAPVAPSLGVFDAIRIGPDVAAMWELDREIRYLHTLSTPQARYAIATSVHRMWLQSLIGTDPDVAYFRTRYCLLTDEQKALIADLTRVCRFRATSDIPATLDPHEHEALRAYLQEDISVRQLGRYRWAIGDREVDFGAVAGRPPVMLPVPGETWA